MAYQPGAPPPPNNYPPQPAGYQPAPPGYMYPGTGYPGNGPYGPPQGGGYPPYGGYPPPQAPGAPPGYPGGPGGYPPGAVIAQPMGGYGPPPSGPPMGGPTMQQDGGWMNMPQGPVNCPPGLEYLTMIDQLLIHQKVELLEAFTGFETKNKFTVKNNIGQKMYYAVEDTDCCTRNCCGPLRPFDMKILDNYRTEVIHLYRPLACDSCCFPCCLQSMEVCAPPGNVIGKIEQEWSIFCPSFVIKNASDDVVLRIEGPLCTMSICGDVEFQVMSSDGKTQVGKISKQWSGLIREMFTDTDYFGVTFPMDLDVRMKAVMLGAVFLIDAMFFEKSGNQERDGIGMI